eukprot:TRINITY_DN3952_c0_g1_i3.p1 TRINITY_DN3952_c0_g1~~TRINITY_DN3952_c0_g1_i3.p1  ORF type:complete len:179 (+),score=36.28 TRINITY_DN3952_c0_g1_i3:27-563(+)
MENDQERKTKQLYLHKVIIESGYNPNTFIEYISSVKHEGSNVDNWTLDELKALVLDYKRYYLPLYEPNTEPATEASNNLSDSSNESRNTQDYLEEDKGDAKCADDSFGERAQGEFGSESRGHGSQRDWGERVAGERRRGERSFGQACSNRAKAACKGCRRDRRKAACRKQYCHRFRRA